MTHPPGEFSVCQFFVDGSCEYVREEAVRAFGHYTTSVGARFGTTRRVILTDGGDCVNFEWKYGEGIVFPSKEEMEKMRENKSCT